MTLQDLPEACCSMARHGGYVLAFSARMAAMFPDLSWDRYRMILRANGNGFCGYAESVVKHAFEQGRK